jgi:hypothetical protein
MVSSGHPPESPRRAFVFTAWLLIAPQQAIKVLKRPAAIVVTRLIKSVEVRTPVFVVKRDAGASTELTFRSQ